MLLKDIISFLEQKAPPALQESYDNSGLIVGSPDMEITAALICLDSTPEVIAEARERGCNLVIAHHPIVFSGLKKLNGKNYIERAVIDAIRHDIAIYAIHTNLDNVAHGVNMKIAEKLGLSNTRVLDPKSKLLSKVAVFVPVSHADEVRKALFDAGAGHIGDYDECSFNTSGTGTFRAGEGTNPHVGAHGEQHREDEVRIETIVPGWKVSRVVSAMKAAHPYEEVAYDIFPLDNKWDQVGAGMLGELAEPMPVADFLQMLKVYMQANGIRYTKPHVSHIRKVAVCGGSGSFLLQAAMAAGADVLVTADFKYHQFFDADGKIIIADIGHFESEQFTMNLLNDWFRQKFPIFATHLTGVITNPVHYL